MKINQILALKSYAKTFVAAFLGQIVTLPALSADVAVWKNGAAAGIAALLKVAYNWANSNDERYGIGS